ncbi:MAG: hypothetical protein JWO38_636 [Gemmataceae bacterium]|nr:hypothetical protein [Gemmataceae bacterium]
MDSSNCVPSAHSREEHTDTPPPGGTNLRSRLPDPTPAVRHPRKLDLAHAAMPVVGDLQAVTQLTVRELKGVGQMFTANMPGAYQFRGVVHKPAGSFESQFQIIAGNALLDPRIARLAQMIAFVPAFAWATFETVLLPVKVTTYGQRVLADLQKLQQSFPSIKCFVQWDDGKRRHVVYRQTLSAAEAEMIGKVAWPDKDAIVDALEVAAFDDIGTLCDANEDIRTLLAAKEV